MTLLKMTLALLVISGCSSNADVSSLYKSVQPFSQSALQQNPDFIAARENGSPLFTAGIESNPGTSALFVRQSRSAVSGVETWIGIDGAQIMLDRGVLIGTRGFGADIMASKVDESQALITSLGSGYATRLMTLLDGENHAITRAFKCQISPGPIQTVSQGLKDVVAQTVIESCRNGEIAFSNFYWLVPSTREIIQSSQWAGELTEKISIRKTPNI